MSKSDAKRLGALPQPPDESAGASPGARVREIARAVRQSARQIFGIPDYERYLAHCAEHHPGEPVLSKREFFTQAIDRKYCKSGPRCC
jgi:uncharacterized short protein YbdD (DUF466 family)